MSDACSPDTLARLHSVAHKLLYFCHLLACPGRDVAGVEDILIDGLEGLAPVDEVLLVVEVAAGVTVEDRHVDALHEFDETAVRNFV
jgi:hypothetical protein